MKTRKPAVVATMLGMVLLIAGAVMLPGCASRSYESTTTIQDTSDGGRIEKTTRVDGREISRLSEEWENEYLIAEGQAPVIDKYPGEPERNKALAKRAALTDAQSALARQVSEVKINQTTIMRDLEVTDLVRTELKTALSNTEVVSERFDETKNAFFVMIRMPKKSLVKVVESYRP